MASSPAASRHLDERLIRVQVVRPPADGSGDGRGRRDWQPIDRVSLQAGLERVVRGEVRFGDGDRAMYASDAGNYRMVPLGIVLPRDADDVERAVAVCRGAGVPIFARGGGTGIPGQTVNDGILFDFSKYMREIVSIDPERRLARVQPGVVLDTLREAANAYGLTFGPDPATHNRCTFGGMIGNNSCGIHSVMAGRTSDNIEALEILTYDGVRMTVGATDGDEYAAAVAGGGRRAEIYAALKGLQERHADVIRQSFPDIPRRVSGYNLPALLPEAGFHVARALVGSECTCVLVLEATVRLVTNPRARALAVLGYPDIFTAADHVMDPLPFGPIALEALDDGFLDAMKKKGLHPPNLALMPDGHAWLLVEFGGDDKADADRRARAMIDDLRGRDEPPAMALLDDPAKERLVWALREEGLGATARVPGEPENHEGWEDTAVPPAQLGAYLRDLKQLLDSFGYAGPLYGHFGQGCVHTRLSFDLRSAGGITRFREFLQEGADLVRGYGGSLSGEHGDGQARGELLSRMFPPVVLDAFREFKSIWDPEWKMNPGKLIDAYRADEHLRLGPGFRLPRPRTYFAYPTDNGSFGEATERCVGAGVCRRHDGGTMCPSYMVTFEEKHSTRGRARLLNEMLRADPVQGGWRSDEVREALDLCLSCKGCKSECPVQVDMATYKAEFLAHYYQGRLRPRTAYTMGHVHQWARLAAWMPGLANFVTQTPVLRDLAKAAAGIHPSRTLPHFASQTLQHWFAARRERRRAGGTSVVMWPDTFTNHLHPQIGQAAVRALEHFRFQVEMPMAAVCCGRPLYDWGMLDAAKARLGETLDALEEPLARGTPIVVLEPSCASVFRDELPNLFPHDERAERLSKQVLLFSELLERHAKDTPLPQLRRRALVHAHCHHRSLMKTDDLIAVLRRLGMDVDAPETGCCGMAGAFGFESAHYDVAMRVGERVLLPAVRAAAHDTLIVSDGFSCYEQIAQATDRRPLHLAEIVDAALRAPDAVPQLLPEQVSRPVEASSAPWRVATAVALAGAAVMLLRRLFRGRLRGRSASAAAAGRVSRRARERPPRPFRDHGRFRRRS